MASTYTLKSSVPAQSLGVGERAAFLARTYQHLLGAVVAVVALEVLLFESGTAAKIAAAVRGVSWLWVLGAFLVVGWFASRTAHRAVSPAAQYAALAAFVAAEALILVPILYHAQSITAGVIESAALVTLLGFAGLTAVAFVTRKDFSFLGGLVRWGMLTILIVVVAGIVFGFRPGTFFSVGIIFVAGAAVLYDTSKVLRRYPSDRHVAAALELFASLAVMFWGVLRLFNSLFRN